MNDSTPDGAPMNQQTLSDIVRGMQHAVNEAQTMLERHFLDVLDRYFDADRRALTAEFRVDDEHVVQAPLIALVHPNGLHLDELSLQFAIEVHDESLKAMPDNVANEARVRQIKAELERLAAERAQCEKGLEKIAHATRDAQKMPREERRMLEEQRRTLLLDLTRYDEAIVSLERALKSVLSRSSVAVTFSPRGGESGTVRRGAVIDVTMKFKSQPQPEGVSRVVDEFTKRILPLASPAPSKPRSDKRNPPAERDAVPPDSF